MKYRIVSITEILINSTRIEHFIKQKKNRYHQTFESNCHTFQVFSHRLDVDGYVHETLTKKCSRSSIIVTSKTTVFCKRNDSAQSRVLKLMIELKRETQFCNYMQKKKLKNDVQKYLSKNRNFNSRDKYL